MHEAFTGPPGPRWQRFVRGGGRLEPAPEGLRLVTEDAASRAYSDAQIDDYQGRSRRSFPWRPPLVFTVRARFSHPAAEATVPADGGAAGRPGNRAPSVETRAAVEETRPGTAPDRVEGASRFGVSRPARAEGPRTALRGTAGFGFWNDPFLMTGLRAPALPRALWFFYASPPSDMKLALSTPGWGWKAAAIDAARWPARLLLPFAPLAVPLFNVRPLYRRFWPLAQAALHVCEARVTATMTTWHTYAIEWGRDSAQFLVDGDPVLACPFAPRGSLGLVLWIDNQYMVATPQGRFRYGFLDVPGRQSLELASVSIEQA